MGIYLGLGSNMGDREAQLRGLAGTFEASGIKIWRSAHLYSTEPRGYEDQPWFLNTVVEVRTLLEPEALLEACLAIERAAGRVRQIPNGPRPLDIDILLYKERIIDHPGLRIPHPRFRERRFVLVPLAELSPDLSDPISALTMSQLLDLCPDAGVVQRYADPLL